MCRRTPKGHTSEFPTRSVAILIICVSVNCYTLVNLFPYVGMMVTRLMGLTSTNEAGFYGGYIASAFTFGRFLSGYAWGHASDKIGQKAVIMVGLSSITVCSIAFGLSTSFAMAVTSRFVLGIMNGIMAASRTSMSEVCGPEHVVTGLTYLSCTKSVGLVVGTGIGGLLSQPSLHYPGVFSSTGLFSRYPFLLPNLLGAAFALAALPCVIFGLPGKKKVDELRAVFESTREEEDVVLEHASVASASHDRHQQGGDSAEIASLDSDHDIVSITASSMTSDEFMSRSPRESEQLPLSGVGEDYQSVPRRTGALVLTPTIVVILIVACVMQMMCIGLDEVFPLWALSTPGVGGLGWGTNEIGQVLLTSGLLLGAIQMGFMNPLVKFFGVVRLQRIGYLMFAAALLNISNAKRMSWDDGSLFTLCVANTVLFNCSAAAVNIGLTVASTTIVPPHHRGKLGGLYNMAESFGRFMGPAGYATVFAYSISPKADDLAWMNYHFVFYSSAAVTAVVACLCWLTLTADTMTQLATGAGREDRSPVAVCVDGGEGNKRTPLNRNRSRQNDRSPLSSSSGNYGSVNMVV